MIFDFIQKNLRWLVLALAALAALFLLIALSRCGQDEARDAGATAQRESNLQETVRNVEKANDAGRDVRNDADAARAECLRNARNPADC